MKILDLGCGKNKMEGAIGVDREKYPGVDVVHNLDDYPYPFKDNEFDFVNCSHIIEHVEEPLRLLEEIYRIAKPGAEVRIVTPHYSSQLSYGDMTHKHHLGYTSFLWLSGRGKFEIKKIQLVFSDIYRVFGISLLANAFKRKWEKYLSFVFPAMYVFVWLRVKK
jgi:SAM-dependent methyltransferase